MKALGYRNKKTTPKAFIVSWSRFYWHSSFGICRDGSDASESSQMNLWRFAHTRRDTIPPEQLEASLQDELKALHDVTVAHDAPSRYEVMPTALAPLAHEALRRWYQSVIFA
jgi:hypothetical protein